MNFIICVISSLCSIKIQILFFDIKTQAGKQRMPNKNLFHLRNKLEHFRTWTERSNRNNLQFVTSSLFISIILLLAIDEITAQVDAVRYRGMKVRYDRHVVKKKITRHNSIQLYSSVEVFLHT
jgi:hypothetical protein